MSGPAQTNIATPDRPVPAWHVPDGGPAPAGAAPWLADLGFEKPEIEANFFRVESKKQRVIVMDVKGFGNAGKPVTLKMKDAAGHPTEKTVNCYAEVRLLDEETLRSFVWQVLSRPTMANLYRVLTDAGPAFKGSLVVSIWGEGRGLNRVTHIVRVRDDAAPVADVSATPDASDVADDVGDGAEEG